MSFKDAVKLTLSLIECRLIYNQKALCGGMVLDKMVRNCREHCDIWNGDRVFLKNCGHGGHGQQWQNQWCKSFDWVCDCSLRLLFCRSVDPAYLQRLRRISTLASRSRSSWAPAWEVATIIRRAW